jgi:prepilin-type N-terminal cleavage/methylation domain-containing protein
MKKLIRIKKSESGFTLIEVIITITLAAILGSFLVTFMGTAITKSADPIRQAQNSAASKGKMETVSAAYAAYNLTQRTSNDWTTFLGKVTSYVTISNFLTVTGMDAIKVTFTEGNQTYISYYPK